MSDCAIEPLIIEKLLSESLTVCFDLLAVFNAVDKFINYGLEIGIDVGRPPRHVSTLVKEKLSAYQLAVTIVIRLPS